MAKKKKEEQNFCEIKGKPFSGVEVELALKVSERANKTKHKAIEKAVCDDRLRLCYVTDDPWTVCLICTAEAEDVIAVGCAKRATYIPMADTQDVVRGKEIALTRAIRYISKRYTLKHIAEFGV